MKNLILTFTAICLISVTSSLEGQKIPLGELSFHKADGQGGSIHDLSISTKSSSDGSIKYQGKVIRKVKPLGSLSWQYFQSTEYFGDVIMIKITKNDGSIFLKAVENGDFQEIYKDEEIRVTYQRK